MGDAQTHRVGKHLQKRNNLPRHLSHRRGQATGPALLPFVLAVLYGASCGFSTPYGSQTNLMVMSPGRYALGDYLRAGLPMAAVYMAICLVMVPVVFPCR